MDTPYSDESESVMHDPTGQKSSESMHPIFDQFTGVFWKSLAQSEIPQRPTFVKSTFEWVGGADGARTRDLWRDRPVF